jgi:elongation factor G
LCGSAFRNKGIQTLLDAIVAFLPNPVELPPVSGINPFTEKKEFRRPDRDEDFAALAFKIKSDPYVGKIAYLRVYSGFVKLGEQVLNVNTGRKERITKLMQVHASKYQPIETVEAGNICALVGFKEIRTGDSLASIQHPILLDMISFPEPVINMAVEPKTQDDVEKLQASLVKLTEEDPTFKVRVDEETGQTIISGMGELHLEVRLDELRREYNIECNQGKPQVSYKEAFCNTIVHQEIYKHQTGGKGRFADITFEIGPADDKEMRGLQFVDEIKGGILPKEYINAVKRGFEMSMMNGVLAGFSVYNMKVVLKSGSFHQIDSDPLAFEIAAKIGFRNAARMMSLTLMEPVMRLEVITPDQYLGEVSSDLNRRRGQIEDVSSKYNAQVLRAKVPLAEMFGYITQLRSLTQGRALYTLEFSHYADLPTDLLEQVLYKIKGYIVNDKEEVIAQRIDTGDFGSAPSQNSESTISHLYEGDCLKLNYPWDIFTFNHQAIEMDFDMAVKQGHDQKLNSTNTIIGNGKLFVDKSAVVNGAILNTSTGPIFIGKNAEVMEGANIRGPFALCEGGVVKMGAKIYGATTIGTFSKVGGECNNVVIGNYTNKAHDGFLSNYAD